MPTVDDTIPCVEIRSSYDAAPAIDELMAGLGHACSSWRSRETNIGLTWVFTEDDKESEEIARLIEASLPDWQEAINETVAVCCTQVKREDWAECWKRHFHAFRASERLIVKPSWETLEQVDEHDIVLELDPGMSFGTGYHGTTRACLQFMDKLVMQIPGASFLEAGCGSGILSLAAARLGCDPIHAFDHDPQAVQCARENLACAGVSHVELSVSDIAAFRPRRQFRVVAANILAHVLDANAEHIVSLVARERDESGYLILAGILTDQYETVRTRYEALGAREAQRTAIDEWTSGLFVLG